jgi:uncharacterized protein
LYVSAFPAILEPGYKVKIMKCNKTAGFSGLFLFLALFAPPAHAQNLPRPKGYVSDFAGVFSEEERAGLEDFSGAVKQQTGAEIAVVSIKSYAPYHSIEEYAAALFGEWGIGQQDEDNGVLLLLSVDDREVKIETGYGLEGILPDSVCGRILDNEVLPEFREGRFSAGLIKGVEAVAGRIAQERGDPASLELSPDDNEDSGGMPSLAVIAIVVIFFVILPLGLSRRRGHFGNLHGPGGFGGGFGGHSGSGGGGFGGFSGGGSGGGGASRKF